MPRDLDLKRVFETEYFREYYRGYRNRREHLFPSELHFIDEFTRPGKSYLEVGCALGGLYDILSSSVADIEYRGTDISPKMIAEARRLHPGVAFDVGDGGRLGYDDASFDRVVSLGTTVHDQMWAELVRELYRVTREVLFLDVRLSSEPTLASLEDGFVRDDAGVAYPYVVVNWNDFRSVLEALEPRPAKVRGFGYWGKANEAVRLPEAYARIGMATFLVYRGRDRESRPGLNGDGSEAAATDFDLELPFRR